jgi:Family of unknown function (DUF5923)
MSKVSDAAILVRSMAGDAATNAAGKLQPPEEKLNQIDQPADDNTWHEVPDLSRSKLKDQVKGYAPFGKKEVKEAAAEGTATAHPDGSTDPRDTAALAVQDQRNGTGSGVDPIGGAQVAANSLREKADTGDVVPKAKTKTKEYNERTQTYLKGKMPKERREQTIWRMKKMVSIDMIYCHISLTILGC